jgi:hypothetical protein
MKLESKSVAFSWLHPLSGGNMVVIASATTQTIQVVWKKAHLPGQQNGPRNLMQISVCSSLLHHAIGPIRAT